MKRTSVILLCALAMMISISGRQAVNAGVHSLDGTARVKGTVKVAGLVPKPHPINMAADPSCANLHSSQAFTQDILADAEGGLQNVVVFIADGLGDRTFNLPSRSAVIEQKGCMYEPHVIALRANQPLEVVNDDPTTHNIHPMPANNREWNKAELPGSKMDETFPREEIAIPVKCNIHPWMRSYIAVFKHPFFTVTGKDGSFDIANLPAGTYTVEAWHEKLGTAIQKITVGANETKAIDFVFRARPGS